MMLHRKWSLLLMFIFVLIGVLYLVPLKHRVEAAFRISCDRNGTCTQVICKPLNIACSNACGQTKKFTSDGCGSKTLCPATAPCEFTCNPPCAQGQTCVRTGGSSCPPGAYCPMVERSTCVANTPTPILANTPTPTSIPANTCPNRSQGDANCDRVINATDYDIFKSKMSGITHTDVNYSVDFNSDNTVNLLDYEIWRNTFYK